MRRVTFPISQQAYNLAFFQASAILWVSYSDRYHPGATIVLWNCKEKMHCVRPRGGFPKPQILGSRGMKSAAEAVKMSTVSERAVSTYRWSSLSNSWQSGLSFRAPHPLQSHRVAGIDGQRGAHFAWVSLKMEVNHSL